MMLKSVLALIVLLSVSLNADAQSCGPQRIRKDIKNLSSNERAALSRALNALYRNGSIKRFVDMHVQMSSVSHNVPEFLARHRVMLKLFEDELVGASEGGLTGLPYWDSTQDARNPRNSVVLTAAYMGSAANGCIREGPASGWTEDNGRCVERGFNGGSWASNVVMGGIAGGIRSYSRLSTAIEYGPHALVHNGIGGNMADLTRSPWDPLFWMHHTGVDFWWAQWQSSVNGAYDGGAFSMGSYRNTDVDDYQNRLCYRYENIGGSGNGGSTPTGTATSATPTGTGAPTSSGTPAPSGSPAPPTNEDIIVPNLKDLQESFLKSFNIPPERISQMEPVFKAVEVYLNTLKAQGKPLPSLASLRDVKLPKNVEDAINGNIKGNEKETNSAASHVNLIVTGLAGLAGALIAAMVV